jgi:hypothetical protein
MILKAREKCQDSTMPIVRLQSMDYEKIEFTVQFKKGSKNLTSITWQKLLAEIAAYTIYNHN